jgi:hypothetical protein
MTYDKVMGWDGGIVDGEGTICNMTGTKKRSSMKTYPIVVVTWIDAMSSMDYYVQNTPPPVTSVGFLIEDNPTYLVLGQTSFDSTDFVHDKISNTIMLPKGMIQEIVRLDASVTQEIGKEECDCGGN